MSRVALLNTARASTRLASRAQRARAFAFSLSAPPDPIGRPLRESWRVAATVEASGPIRYDLVAC